MNIIYRGNCIIIQYAAFEPIIVTGDDGHEYNVIPSDQFK